MSRAHRTFVTALRRRQKKVSYKPRGTMPAMVHHLRPTIDADLSRLGRSSWETPISNAHQPPSESMYLPSRQPPRRLSDHGPHGAWARPSTAATQAGLDTCARGEIAIDASVANPLTLGAGTRAMSARGDGFDQSYRGKSETSQQSIQRSNSGFRRYGESPSSAHPSGSAQRDFVALVAPCIPPGLLAGHRFHACGLVALPWRQLCVPRSRQAASVRGSAPLSALLPRASLHHLRPIFRSLHISGRSGISACRCSHTLIRQPDHRTYIGDIAADGAETFYRGRLEALGRGHSRGRRALVYECDLCANSSVSKQNPNSDRPTADFRPRHPDTKPNALASPCWADSEVAERSTYAVLDRFAASHCLVEAISWHSPRGTFTARSRLFGEWPLDRLLSDAYADEFVRRDRHGGHATTGLWPRPEAAVRHHVFLRRGSSSAGVNRI